MTVKIGCDLTRYEARSIRGAFEAECRKTFGLIFPDHAIELVNWTVEISNDHALSEPDDYGYEHAKEGGSLSKGSRTVVAASDAGSRIIPVINRYALRPGDVIAGAALIEENDTTIYLPAQSRAVVAQPLGLVADLETRL